MQTPWRNTEDYIPKKWLDAYRLARGYARYPACWATLRKNREWHNAFCGERVYVIANGPSLISFDRGVFRGQKVIVMNSFDRAEWKDEVDIIAHCFGEPRQSAAWHDPHQTFLGTRSASYWMHFSAMGEVHGVPPSKRIYYVLPAYEPHVWGRRTLRLDRVTLGYQTTAQLAIMVALHMGFKDIILLGFDHDWLANPQYSKHFYSSAKDSSDVLGTHSYYSLLQFSLRMWEIYYALNDAAIGNGAFIRNMTSNSYLDVFPRCKPGNLFL